MQRLAMFTGTAGLKTCATSAAVLLLVCGAVAPGAQQTRAAGTITSPKEQFGHDIGDDYFLVNYTQDEQYLKKLARESARMTVLDIGRTAEGRIEYTAIITSPENQKRLASIQGHQPPAGARRGLTDDQARQLAGTARRWSGSTADLHASEVLGAQQLIEEIYALNTRTDAETMRILNDDIVLCTLVNPDGMELVANWYMREPDPSGAGRTGGLPRLYQKYIGHDNNRDFYMIEPAGERNVNRIMYREWYPADHVQPSPDRAGRRGAVRAAVPRSVQLQLRSAGAASASTWSAGDAQPSRRGGQAGRGDALGRAVLDLVQRRHPHHGVLPQPDRDPDRDHRQPDAGQIPFVPEKQLPRGDVPNPIAPQTWHFRQSIEYSMIGQLCAILDLASKRNARTSCSTCTGWAERHRAGQPDNWTITPKRIKAETMRRGPKRDRGGRRRRRDAEVPALPRRGRGGRRRRPHEPVHSTVLHDPVHARSARLHHALGPGRFPHRDEVRQHAASRPASRC